MNLRRRTKIVATLGPASESRVTLRGMLQAGVDVVRLNFSHGTQEEKANQMETVRELEQELGRPVAIMQDIQGPKIRVGPILDPPLTLTQGQHIDIYGDARLGSSDGFSTTYPELAHEVDAGDAIFLDDGAIELRAISLSDDTVHCEVVVGGDLSGGKGVNLPGARISAPALTEKDRDDLHFGLERGVDYVALSFVRSPQDAAEAHAVMGDVGVFVPLIAKVEKREAVARMNAVLRAFDGVMVARGDLGVELRPEKVPGVQKQLISRAIALRRPVITATQMLESMTFNRRPTRAEASDVANAVLDGSHAVMLSGETAIGEHPIEVVRAMHRIVLEAERLDSAAKFEVAGDSATHAFCAAAAYLAEQIDAAALVAFTRSGRTAQTLSSLLPSRPIVALCEQESMARRLCLWRGVVPVLIPRSDDDAASRMQRELSQRQLFSKGSRLVALGAEPGSRAGQTNFIRLLRV